ncbi:DNA polymerase III subunit gamma/tau [Flavobacterium ardleyense]|uniref:DNA polymerase III subunit gamma/tau n=1 Tax=Flavobacterium ardleyense TaxID=2038737 RepID=A0ABW5Z5K2_9FLAO
MPKPSAPKEEKQADATPVQKTEPLIEVAPQEKVIAPTAVNPVTPHLNTIGTKVSALSIASIKAKKDIEAQQQSHQKAQENAPAQAFTETDMLLLWTKFAERMTKEGKRLLATYMQMNDPTLNGTTITLELPNQGTKEDFLSGCHELMTYLRGRLHNHEISIEVIVNEVTETKFAFTPQEKYDRLRQINPNLDLLRKVFDLDV